MALRVHHPSLYISLPWSLPLPILRLRRALKSSTCGRFLRSTPESQIRRRHGHLAAPRLVQAVEEDEEEGRWLLPTASSSGAQLDGALDEEEETGGFGQLNGEDAEEEQLEEEGECDGEVGKWDPPVSPFRAHGLEVEEPHHQEEDEEGEEEEGSGGGAWWDPNFFLPNQEGAGGISTANEAMEEILDFARTSSPHGPGLAEFLDEYSGRALGEEECLDLMRRMGEEGLTLGCLQLFRWMRAKQEQPMPLHPQAWLVAVVVLGRARMADEVLEIVGSLPPTRGLCEAAIYNAAMSSVAFCGRYDDAWRISELMENNNVQHDSVTYSIMLKVMEKTKKSAKEAWEFFQRTNRKCVKWSLDVSTSLIKIFCEEGLKKEALIILSEMEKRGIASNTSIYNTLINAYCKSNHIEEAEGLFVEMKEKDIKPTTVTYNILMGAYSRRLQPEVVESLLVEMQDFELQPNARSYNCLIAAYGGQKKKSDEAEDAFLRMKTNGIKATSSSYTSLLRAYAVNGQHEEAHNAYIDMKSKGLKPSLETYTALLHTFRRAGETEKVMKTWKSMINEKVGGTRITFHMILDCLAKHGLYVQARDVIDEFKKIGLLPTVMTYNILMNAYARGGQHYKLPQLLKEMTALEIKPDCITYSTIIYAYARVRDFSRAFYYHKLMIRCGQLPDAKSYRKLLNTLDVKTARKNVRDKGAIAAVIKGKSGLKHRKEKKDEFWKNRRKRTMTLVSGYQRKRYL